MPAQPNDAQKVTALNRSSGKCSRCHVPLSYLHHGDLTTPTGWVILAGAAVCASCVRAAGPSEA